MADPEHNRQNCQTRDTKNLNYGHFGTATYEESTHKWHFLRQPQDYHQDDYRRPGLHSLQLIHEPIRHHGVHNPEVNTSSHNAPAWFAARRTLLKHTPELFGAAPLLLTSSENDVLGTHYLQQTPREVLAFGHARAIGDRGSHSRLVPIVAVPVGAGGETVRFLGTDTGAFVPQDESAPPSDLRVPRISGSRTGYWWQSADRILQISFCASHNRTQLLVQKAGGTSILRPIIRPRMASVTAFPKAGRTNSERTASTIEPNHILTITCSRTGGHHHTDAMFNPLDPSVLAIADTSGQWSLWKIKGKQSQSTRVTWRAKLLQQGNLFDTDPQPLNLNRSIDLAGWYRVCWLSNSSEITERILVCSRFSATIFTTEGAFVNHVDMRLGPSSDGVCILDVKQSQRSRQLIYVLSTAHLQIFTTSQLDLDLGSRTEPLNLLCAWKHFRDEGDLDLRMTIQEFSRSSWVFLYSPSSNIATVYQFCLNQSGSQVESSGEPTSLQWPKRLCGRVKTITNLVTVPLTSRVNNHEPDELNLGVINLVAWTSQGTMVEAFYRHGLEDISGKKKEVKGEFHFPLLEPTSQPYLSSRFVDEDDLDNFVVSDETETENEWTTFKPPEPALHKDTRALSYRAEILQWDDVLDDIALQSDERNRPTVTESFERLYQRGTRLCDGLGPISTLSYQLRVPRILDLEAASQRVDEWINTVQATSHVFVQPTNSYSKSLLYAIGETSLLTVYNAYLSAYITPLSSHVSDRNRVNREKIVRQATADAFFSSIILRTDIQISEAEDTAEAAPGQVDSSDLPQHSSQPLVSTTPSLCPESIVSRLCSYTTFKRESSQLLSTSGVAISKLLEHLPTTIDSDPTSYSYEATNKKIQDAQDEEAELSLDARERRKIRRQSTKRLKALEKQTKYSQEVQAGRAMIPSVTNRRLAPILPGREVRSSQPGILDSSPGQSQAAPVLNMSQPERGAYETRPSLKKRAKEKVVVKRKAGF
ncbi:uncharacterized protein A1O9_11206 [Exophiala aquamarina CBS 119918]|uniref:RNA polymerase I-specific transcription initiation factor RRN6-like protein n=1 Tax=Exophiala aquamarina CBS 119918 TaxID=1182545 RepID=A0A072NY65_9EURO|nr:uncharacterized protein A1O9_11206 [Exophiala aquamarina CBS 119918]KEF52789.1 hypothetical protein A1O9_11206 [Exophiala aquamarina CBS 119918]